MSDSLASLLGAAVTKVTKDYAKIKKKEDREQRRNERLREHYFSGRSSRTTIKDAAAAAIPDAYDKASGSGKYPANARQIMYAARGAILAATGESRLDSKYFTQTLLPDYEKNHPEETANWDVVYDARGHILEPHTNHQFGLGTIEVREYLGSFGDVTDAIELPTLSVAYPTKGPKNRYSSILYIEKEGFLPLLQAARFAERYDLAIMSSKGMSTTAARTLIERLCEDEQVTIYVLHDFDKSGFSILGTLTRDTRRYEYISTPTIVDLGLRLTDVNQWNLESEDVSYGKNDPTWNLRENGATTAEVEFLCSKNTYHGHSGRRVELNAFTSDQFVEWLDGKLEEHGAKKVIPDEATVTAAYRHAEAIRRYQQIIDEGEKEVADAVKSLKVPKGLRAKIGKILREKPELPWDEAIRLCL